MSEDRPPLQDDEVIFLARKAIAQAREETPRRNDPDPDVVAKDLQQPGVTIDLGHHSIKRLPDDVVDIIKADIERCACLPRELNSNALLLETSANRLQTCPLPQLLHHPPPPPDRVRAIAISQRALQRLARVSPGRA